MVRIEYLARLAALVTVWPAAVLANDGFGGLSATGLHFSATDAVAMAEEDLFISKDKITVRYVFRNLTTDDVTGEVIFPMPPISLDDLQHSDWNLPEDLGKADLVNFTATVAGKPVAVTLDRLAVMAEPLADAPTLSAQYDTPGQDITEELTALGVPVTLELSKVTQALATLSADQLQMMVERGYLSDMSLTGSAAAEDLLPAWSVLGRYHWSQTFPAGAELVVEHSYDNRPWGGLFSWSHPPQDWEAELAVKFCVDEGTSKAITRSLNETESDGMVMGVSYQIAYVLRTANSWAGPIGKFRLTIDKSAPENVISLCAEGVKKTSPTTFQVEYHNYTPSRDLDILLVTPLAQ